MQHHTVEMVPYTWPLMCAGTETLCSSSDLQHYPLQDAVRTCQRIGARGNNIQDTKMAAEYGCASRCKLCLHVTRYLANFAAVGTSATASSCVSDSAAHKRRQRNRPLPNSGCAEVLVAKNSANGSPHFEPVRKAQCDCNLANEYLKAKALINKSQ